MPLSIHEIMRGEVIDLEGGRHHAMSIEGPFISPTIPDYLRMETDCPGHATVYVGGWIYQGRGLLRIHADSERRVQLRLDLEGDGPHKRMLGEKWIRRSNLAVTLHDMTIMNITLFDDSDREVARGCVRFRLGFLPECAARSAIVPSVPDLGSPDLRLPASRWADGADDQGPRVFVVGLGDELGRSVVQTLEEEEQGERVIAVAQSGDELDGFQSGNGVRTVVAQVDRQQLPLGGGDVVIHSGRNGGAEGVLQDCARTGAVYLDGAMSQSWSDRVLRAARQHKQRFFTALGIPGAVGEFLARELLSAFPDAHRLDVLYRVGPGALLARPAEMAELFGGRGFFALEGGRRKRIELGGRTWNVPGLGLAMEVPGAESVGLEGSFGGELRVGVVSPMSRAPVAVPLARAARWSSRNIPGLSFGLKKAAESLPRLRMGGDRGFEVRAVAFYDGTSHCLTLRADDPAEFSGRLLAWVAMDLAARDANGRPAGGRTAASLLSASLLGAAGGELLEGLA
jgi:hypothetical protein